MKNLKEPHQGVEKIDIIVHQVQLQWLDRDVRFPHKIASQYEERIFILPEQEESDIISPVMDRILFLYHSRLYQVPNFSYTENITKHAHVIYRFFLSCK